MCRGITLQLFFIMFLFLSGRGGCLPTVLDWLGEIGVVDLIWRASVDNKVLYLA